MAATDDTTPALRPAEIIERLGKGKLSRDGCSVILGYGPIGYLRLLPSRVILRGVEHAAVEIQGRLSRGNGGHHKQLRAAIRAAGLEIR